MHIYLRSGLYHAWVHSSHYSHQFSQGLCSFFQLMGVASLHHSSQCLTVALRLHTACRDSESPLFSFSFEVDGLPHALHVETASHRCSLLLQVDGPKPTGFEALPRRPRTRPVLRLSPDGLDLTTPAHRPVLQPAAPEPEPSPSEPEHDQLAVSAPTQSNPVPTITTNM